MPLNSHPVFFSLVLIDFMNFSNFSGEIYDAPPALSRPDVWNSEFNVPHRWKKQSVSQKRGERDGRKSEEHIGTKSNRTPAENED